MQAVGENEFDWRHDGFFVFLEYVAGYFVSADRQIERCEFASLIGEFLEGWQGDSDFGFLEDRERFALHNAGDGKGDDAAIGTDLKAIADLNGEALHDAGIDQRFVFSFRSSAEEHGRWMDDPLLREIDAMHGYDTQGVPDEFVAIEIGVEFEGAFDRAEVCNGRICGEARGGGLDFGPGADYVKDRIREFAVRLVTNAQVGPTHCIFHDSAD